MAERHLRLAFVRTVKRGVATVAMETSILCDRGHRKVHVMVNGKLSERCMTCQSK